jgi:hypothetical protein
VIVPEFGGFIANYESAWINHARNLIYPPHKQILFNGNLVQNDGLLANELMIKMSFSYAVAQEKMAEQVKYWRNQLQDGERIELGEIGFLFLQNDQVVFEQNREANLLLQAYGFKQVTFTHYKLTSAKQAVTVEPSFIAAKKITQSTEVGVEPVKKVESTKINKPSVFAKKQKNSTPVIALSVNEKIEPVVTDSEEQQVIPLTRKKARNYKYAVAAAVVLPALFYAYWIPMKTDFLNTGRVQVSDFNPFNEQAKAVYHQRDSAFVMDDFSSGWKSWDELTGTLPGHVAVYNLELNEELYIPVRLDVDSDGSAFNANGSFHIIAGCFSVENNANSFVAQLVEKGYAAGIVDQHKGLYRVSAGAFNNESEAESALDKLESEGFSAWILKK